MEPKNQETPPFIPVIDKMEQIINNPWIKDPRMGKLIDLSRRVGVGSMPYVLKDFIEISNHTKLSEIKNESGEVIAYQPQIELTVDWHNADTVIRQLFSSQIIFYTLFWNEHFKIKNVTSETPKGPFRVTSDDTYTTLTRTGSREQMLELMSAYATKALEVKQWKVSKAKEILNLAKDLGLEQED